MSLREGNKFGEELTRQSMEMLRRPSGKFPALLSKPWQHCDARSPVPNNFVVPCFGLEHFFSGHPLTIFSVQIKFYYGHLICPVHGFSYYRFMLQCGCSGEKTLVFFRYFIHALATPACFLF